MTSTVGGPVGSCETASAAVVHSSSLPTADKGPGRSCSFNSATAYHYTHYDTSNVDGVSGRYDTYLNVIFRSLNPAGDTI